MQTEHDDARFAAQVERLLTGADDHGLDDELARFCRQVAAACPAPGTEFAEALNGRLRSEIEKQEGRLMWRMKHTRLTTKIALALVAALVIVTVAYAVDALLQRIINYDAGLKAVNDAELGTPLNLSQTVDDLTVNLQWVYADENRISLGYVVSGEGPLDSPAQDYYPRDMVLSDGDGNVFPSAGGMGYTGEGGEAAQVSSFDTSKVGSLPETLNLHLELRVEIMTHDARATLEAKPTPAPDATSVVEQIGPGDFPFSGPYGPFVFDFSVSSKPSRIINFNQTVTDQDVPITLKRVIIAPSQTRVEVCFDPPVEKEGGWALIPFLSINGSDLLTENPPVAPGEQLLEGTNCHSLIYNAAFGDRTGDWSLRIQELVGFGASGADALQTRISGSWVFHFTVNAE
ncbi:MAG: DUF4179 domain-containing protein [Anaerolineae bacterium]|nr:DUF4179 domain-containing protein [Anaerolineae bacterium]